MLYLASSNVIPLIPLKDEAPAFHVRALNAAESRVRTQFSLDNAVYAGSSTGCGCAFRHALLDRERWFDVLDADGDDESTNNMVELSEFVEALICAGNNLELYGCWDGDETEPVYYTESIRAESLREPSFFLKERALYRIASRIPGLEQ